MFAADRGPHSLIGELELRQLIDHAVSRALFDDDFARTLLADPTLVLNDRGCQAQQYLSLRSIDARSLLEFAQQARALFWIADPLPLATASQSSHSSGGHRGRRTLVGAAGR